MVLGPAVAGVVVVGAGAVLVDEVVGAAVDGVALPVDGEPEGDDRPPQAATPAKATTRPTVAARRNAVGEGSRRRRLTPLARYCRSTAGSEEWSAPGLSGSRRRRWRRVRR